jgi:RHS repeat-associated protein
MQRQQLDQETGLFYNRYRYYDPAGGRYVTQDLIGLAGGVNKYVYPSNPLQKVDPLGLYILPVLYALGEALGWLAGAVIIAKAGSQAAEALSEGHYAAAEVGNRADLHTAEIARQMNMTNLKKNRILHVTLPRVLHAERVKLIMGKLINWRPVLMRG